MKIVEQKRSTFSAIALIFGILYLFISVMEFIHISLNEPLIFFFSSPGDTLFETSYLDHLMKGFINLVISSMFLYTFFKLKEGTLEGFGFLIGAGFLSFGIGLLFIAEWIANLIDFLLIGIMEPEIWEGFTITDGIRLECFLGIASIYILWIWKNKERYLTLDNKF
ncbi:MAG: hypothetical protein ACTSVV_17170 [Promethearchaeota archaeon]